MHTSLGNAQNVCYCFNGITPKFIFALTKCGISILKWPYLLPFQLFNSRDLLYNNSDRDKILLLLCFCLITVYLSDILNRCSFGLWPKLTLNLRTSLEIISEEEKLKGTVVYPALFLFQCKYANPAISHANKGYSSWDSDQRTNNVYS